MLQRGEQRQRRQALARQIEHQAQEDAGRRLVEGHAGGIVDLDVPAPQLGGDATREPAVGRDQRRGVAGLLQALAQQEGDDRGFFLRAGAVEPHQPVERRRIEAGETAPAVALRRRPQRLGDEAPSHAAAARKSRRRPGAEIGRLDLEPAQQPRREVLRMCRIGGNLAPALGVDRAIDVGQHHGAVRQAGDDGEEIGDCGHAAGDPGGDDRVARRLAAPRLGLRRQHAVAPLRRIEAADLREQLWPMLGEDGEEGEALLPMLGVVRGHQGREPRQVAAFALHLVEEARQLARERRRLACGQRPAAARASPAEHETGEQELAPQLRHRWRDVEAGLACRVLAEEHQLLGIDIADGHEARQQQRLAAAGAQEGLAQGARRPARRQQNGLARQRQRIMAGLGEQPRHQRVEKRQIRGDGEDGGTHRALPR